MRIYLDNNATTPVSAEVLRAMNQAGQQIDGNPDSVHFHGRQTRKLLEQAKERILSLVGTNTNQADLFFTSGGTESNNWAIVGLGFTPEHTATATQATNNRNRVVISGGEHSSVLVPAEHFFLKTLDILALDQDGVVREDLWRGYLTPQVRLVSIQTVNHETGAMQPVRRIAQAARNAGALFHSDAVQAAGKIPLTFDEWGLDAMTITAHKIHGPVGIGALIVRKGVPLAPILFGGGQQNGLRPGTQPAMLAVGLAEALRIAVEEMNEEQKRLSLLRDKFELVLETALPGCIIHAQNGPRLGHVSNIAFPGHRAVELRERLDVAGVECSVGSACNTAAEVSPTLMAMGISREEAQSSLRFSFGRKTHQAEIIQAVKAIVSCCQAQE